jgi:hypothetical protein
MYFYALAILNVATLYIFVLAQGKHFRRKSRGKLLSKAQTGKANCRLKWAISNIADFLNSGMLAASPEPSRSALWTSKQHFAGIGANN